MMTTTYKRLLLLAALPAFLLASCSREEMGGEQDTQNGAIRFEIGFAPQTEPHTRVATDTQFNSTWEEGDEIGIYAVKHGTELAASGNYIHNVKLTYTGGSWTVAEDLYWPVGSTKLDFYAYHPYDASTTDPTAITFNVQADQKATTGAKSNYNLSDLLMAKADNSGNGFGKGETVQLSFKHALAMVQVNVSSSMIGDYAPDALAVWLNGCTTDCVLNLSGQSTTPPSNPIPSTKQITMYPCPNDDSAPGIYAYRALVPEQTIASGIAMFSFKYDGSISLSSKKLNSDLPLAQGKAETFGMTFPFTSATVSSTVRLASLFTNEELAQITHLKVLGEMTEADFTTIRESMASITSLDLDGATVVGNAIPDEAFMKKTSLKEFVFPRNITTIGNSAFYECSGLTGDLTIPKGVTTIGDYAFWDCSGFTGPLTIPEGVTAIGNDAFANCLGLTGSLTIPKGVETIGFGAFMGCRGFTGSLTIPEGLTTIGYFAFSGCSGLTGSLTIPEGVTTIGDYAFEYCIGFTGSLTIPQSVTRIDSYAFNDCRNLTSITCHIQRPDTVNAGDDIFNMVSNSIPLYVPKGTEEVYRNTPPWKDFTQIESIAP